MSTTITWRYEKKKFILRWANLVFSNQIMFLATLANGNVVFMPSFHHLLIRMCLKTLDRIYGEVLAEREGFLLDNIEKK